LEEINKKKRIRREEQEKRSYNDWIIWGQKSLGPLEIPNSVLPV
jgi:hypothetical protein